MSKQSRKRWIASLFTALGLAVALACTTTESTGAVPVTQRVRIGEVLWHTDYNQAVEVARAANKALWMHFGENPG